MEPPPKEEPKRKKLVAHEVLKGVSEEPSRATFAEYQAMVADTQEKFSAEEVNSRECEDVGNEYDTANTCSSRLLATSERPVRFFGQMGKSQFGMNGFAIFLAGTVMSLRTRTRVLVEYEGEEEEEVVDHVQRCEPQKAPWQEGPLATRHTFPDRGSVTVRLRPLQVLLVISPPCK